jgi:mannonate dehydratase
MILTELLSARPIPLWNIVKQSGVNEIVALMRGAEQEQRTFPAAASRGSEKDPREHAPWSFESLLRDKELFAEHGFSVVAIEDTPPMDLIRLGLPGRDEEIENFITQLRAMGRLGIPVLGYNWMAVSSWTRTNVAVTGRGGALVTGFDKAESEGMPALAEPGSISPEQLWDGLRYFLDAIVPVAKEEGVQMGMHPDDPPLPQLRGIPRIMGSVDAYRRLLELNPSDSNGITFCQGNITLMTDDMPSLIHEWKDKIAYVHFRDVRGTADSFVETFHDEGRTDMAECMRAYSQIGFSGPMRPDHVPTMFGESNDNPSYGTLGRIFALGYIRGLEHATFGKARVTP